MQDSASNQTTVHARVLRQPRRRAGVLFEVMLAVALFGGAAAFTLAAVRSVFASLDRVNLQQEAIDLAKTKLAELEAGLITLADLRDHNNAQAVSGDRAASSHAWTFDVKTQRTEFEGLTLIALTVRQEIAESEHTNAVQFTLRQLIALHGADIGGDDA